MKKLTFEIILFKSCKAPPDAEASAAHTTAMGGAGGGCGSSAAAMGKKIEREKYLITQRGKAASSSLFSLV